VDLDDEAHAAQQATGGGQARKPRRGGPEWAGQVGWVRGRDVRVVGVSAQLIRFTARRPARTMREEISGDIQRQPSLHSRESQCVESATQGVSPR
jgi:hypothetical protein